MISKSERLLIFRFLFSKKSDGYVSIFAWFSIIGISLGVAAIIIVMSVMNGFRIDLTNRIIGLNSVGMSRNDISSESISLIKKAYKFVYRKGLKIDEAIKKIKELNKDQNDSFLHIFIKSLEISERGILR